MINPMHFLLGVLIAKDLEPQDKITVGLLSGLTRLPAAPLLLKPVADKVTEQAEEVKTLRAQMAEFESLTQKQGVNIQAIQAVFQKFFKKELNISTAQTTQSGEGSESTQKK